MTDPSSSRVICTLLQEPSGNSLHSKMIQLKLNIDAQGDFLVSVRQDSVYQLHLVTCFLTVWHGFHCSLVRCCLAVRQILVGY